MTSIPQSHARHDFDDPEPYMSTRTFLDNSEGADELYRGVRLLATEQLPRFSYTTLAPKHIRVLELQPGDRLDHFEGRFLVTSTDDDNIAYDALSYQWGDAKTVDYVVVEHSVIPIARSLSRALEYLRNRNSILPLRIWVDAICVDQNNRAEREQQVAMMRSIYQKARCVRIWIYEPNLDEYSAAMVALQSFLPNTKEPNMGLGHSPVFWEPVEPIFQNEDWTRVWIQQEVINARRLMLHCMNVEFPGRALLHFRQAVLSHFMRCQMLDHETAWNKTTDALMGTHTSVYPRETYVLHGEQRRQVGLIDLLERFGYLNVSDDLDRLYAIMHLAADYSEGDITVNYSKTVQGAMVDAAAHHVIRHRNLRFLHDSFKDREDMRDHEYSPPTACPSWIPETWLGYGRLGVRIEVGDDEDNLVHIDGERLYTKCSSNAVDSSSMQLHVRGIRLDSIQRCLSIGSEPDEMTVEGFWKSPLGQHLHPYMDNKGATLPLQIFRAINNGSPAERFLHSDIALGLSELFAISNDAAQADRVLGFRAELIDDLLESLGDFSNKARTALHQAFENLAGSSCIFTDRDYFGLVPDCDIEICDEVWMVLGCSLPVVVRRRDDGTYLHICTARIPLLMDGLIFNEDEEHFSGDIQTGDKIGEWTVEDIVLV